MFGLFNKPKSKNVAKERLQFVLVQDRCMLSPSDLEAMKDDIIAVISKYVSIDNEAINIDIFQDEKNEKKTTLQANIPIFGNRNRAR
jgi:cell division topological specificity factor